ncbi:MAG: hypothetical protein AAB375_00780 [Patescibacteria group bacterium]
MTTRVFKYALLSAIVLVAIIAGAWYFFAAPKEFAAMPGSISGTVSYPSDGIPPLRVCAVPVGGSDSSAVCVETKDSPPASPDFTIKKLTPGDYYVYAQIIDPAALGSDIPASFKAYYNEFVRCGLKYECKDATRIVVRVSSGADTPGTLPHDWYH